MQPSENFKKLLRLMKLCGAACGANVFDKNYKVGIVTICVFFSITVYFIFTAYTVYIRMQEGWAVILESFCMVGKVLQGISKLLSGIILKELLVRNVDLLTDIYENYELMGGGYVTALHECLNLTQKIVRITASLYSLSIPLIMVLPFFSWLLTGNRVLAMQFYIPGLDPTETTGYVLTLGMQLCCLFFGAFGNFAGDMFVFTMFAHTTLFVLILRLKIKELNELAAELGKSSEVMEKLLDALQWHQTFSKYTEEANYLSSWINSMEIATSGVSIVFILFILINGNWYGAYTYLCLEFALLYMYCGVGTMVEIANDDVIAELYAIHWYNLTIPQQKIVLFMLMKAQSPVKVTIGGVVPLSVNTGLQVTKTVYSVFMMLLNELN